MSGIQRNIIVLVIAISFWGNALASEHCSDRSPEYKKAGFVAFDAFNDLVNVSMNDPSKDITPYMDTYNKSLTDFLNTSYTYCTVNETITTENYTDYLTVVKFSLLNSTVLKKLEENGAFGCILAKKPNIDNCIEEYVKQNITLHNNYSLLHIKSYLSFNSVACKRTKDIKTCVLKVLKEDNKCFMATEYVTSLFDFVYSNNCNDITADSSNAPVNIIGHWSFFVMVSLWTSLVVNKSWFN